MKIDCKLGLTIGAAAGVGFAILEAQRFHNIVFASGWTWDLTYIKGIGAFLPFIESFFAVAFHVGATSLAGYGLATGKGWQFYLIVSVLHVLFNFSLIFVQTKIFSIVEVEILMALLAIIIIAVALWLRWRTSNSNHSNLTKKHV